MIYPIGRLMCFTQSDIKCSLGFLKKKSVVIYFFTGLQKEASEVDLLEGLPSTFVPGQVAQAQIVLCLSSSLKVFCLYMVRNMIELIELIQPANDVRTTLLQRRFNVLTSFQRPYNVVLTSCASWEGYTAYSISGTRNLLELWRVLITEVILPRGLKNLFELWRF